MHVLVTGATGFVGRHVVSAIAQHGHSVRALIRSIDAARNRFSSDVELLQGDLLSPETLSQALGGADAVVHLAIGVTPDRGILLDDTIHGTANLCDAMVSQGVTRLVHCSSRAVYDSTRAQVLDESAPLEAGPEFRNDYANAKIAQEKLISKYAAEHHWNVTILRPGFIWGEGREQLAGWGHSLGPLHLVVDGRRVLPMTYVENCADCFALAIEQPQAAGEVFNVVDDDLPTARQFAEMILKLERRGGIRVNVPYWCGLWLAKLATGINRTLLRGRVRLPGLLIPAIYRARFRPLHFSNRKVKEVLGWRPRFDFREAWERARAGTQAAAAKASQEALRGN